MLVINQSSPFGSGTRTRVLLALRLMGSSYPRELARVLDTALNGVQGAIRSLERDGLITGRAVGRTRLFELNPRYFAATELRALVDKLAGADRDLQDRIATLRRRPRRTAKPL
ncbi:MAG: winged helix-turn-helix transcriptional regulator [Acidobacteria bacterium]|jgi:DNA-binding MarR family transcriptional regulator|nr:winged helix-turn-helix transcriptional regulator [Acidobacteriota bacterium]